MAEAPLVFVDLEMTGLDLETDRVIEICLERRRGAAPLARLESLIRPPDTVSFHTDVHGIDRSALVTAPTFGEVAEQVVAILDGAILVAHGAATDVAFLERELERAGRGLRIGHYLDTLQLTRRALWSERHSLEALAERLGIPRLAPHRAGDDVKVLGALFDRVVGELRPATLRDLWHVRVGQAVARPDVLAACAEAVRTGVPVEISYRPSHKEPRKVLGVLTRMRTDLDPPRVMGYALADRGRFELRADRILWMSSPGGPNPGTDPS